MRSATSWRLFLHSRERDSYVHYASSAIRNEKFGIPGCTQPGHIVFREYRLRLVQGPGEGLQEAEKESVHTPDRLQILSRGDQLTQVDEHDEAKTTLPFPAP